MITKHKARVLGGINCGKDVFNGPRIIITTINVRHIDRQEHNDVCLQNFTLQKRESHFWPVDGLQGMSRR